MAPSGVSPFAKSPASTSSRCGVGSLVTRRWELRELSGTETEGGGAAGCGAGAAALLFCLLRGERILAAPFNIPEHRSPKSWRSAVLGYHVKFR